MNDNMPDDSKGVVFYARRSGDKPTRLDAAMPGENNPDCKFQLVIVDTCEPTTIILIGDDKGADDDHD